MALQTSGAISLGDIAAEYGGSAPHALSEYRGSGNAPGTGAIRLGADFYGTSRPPDSAWLYSALTQGATTTSTGVPFGTPHSSRYIVVGVGNETGGIASATAVTVGGVSATMLAGSNTSAGNHLSMWGASVPSGTSGNVVVTRNGSVPSAISVMGLYVKSPTPTATVGNQNTSPSNVSVNTVGPKGIVATFAFYRDDMTTFNSLSGATHNDTRPAFNWRILSGLAINCPTASPRSVSWNWAYNNNSQRAVAASFEGA